MLTKTMLKNLNDAIHSELFASNLYKHVANQLQRLGYFGAQKFFLSESSDELGHYQKIVDYINDRGLVATVPQIEMQEEKVTSLRDALAIGFDTEKTLSEDYSEWFKQAFAEDVVTAQFFLQFIEHQRKSVGEYGDLLARLDRAGNNEAAILMIDQELGEE
jgi:ferritin